MSDHYDRYNGMENLPSMNLAEAGTDSISRQALLDKFEPWLKVKDYNDGELNMLKAILYEIRFMPSAQPKIIRCCECKYLQCNMRPDGYLPKGVDEFECRHWCGSCDPMDFCSYAERREDG